MTKRSLGIALLVGLPVLGGGAYAVHALTAKPEPRAVAEAAPAPDEPRAEHKKKHKHHHKKKQAKAEKPDKGGQQSIDGTFARWLVAPHGDPVGLMLGDGTVVRLPHGVVADPSLKQGDALHVEGHMAPADQGKVMGHATVTKAGQTILVAAKGDHADKAEHAKTKLQDMTVSGKVLAMLPGRKGTVLGLVLDDGTVVSFGKKGGGVVESDLGVHLGDQVTVEGKGGTYDLGKGVMAQTVKLPSGELKSLGRGKGA